MHDDECVSFLQWALPALGMRWAGFRKVRRQVCRRISRRMKALGLEDVNAYRGRLQTDPREWGVLASLCRVTISRFYRDRGVFEHLGAEVLPRLAAAARDRGETRLFCWSAGCASGEEPYSVALTWHLRVGETFPDLSLRVLGTDIDPALLRRAKRARYPLGSLKELPEPWRRCAFERVRGDADAYRLRAEYRRGVALARQDLRAAISATAVTARFDLVLCRNLVFTYFDRPWQERLATELGRRLLAGGTLVVGSHESVPPGVTALYPAPGPRGFYVKR